MYRLNEYGSISSNVFTYEYILYNNYGLISHKTHCHKSVIDCRR